MLVTRTGLGATELATLISAVPVIVVGTDAELLVATGSNSLSEAPAVLVRVPAPTAVAVMVMLALLLVGSVPRVKVTVLPFVLQAP